MTHTLAIKPDRKYLQPPATLKPHHHPYIMHLRPFFFIASLIMCIKASPAPLQLSQRQSSEDGVASTLTCGSLGTGPSASDCYTLNGFFSSLNGAYQIIRVF